jgi:hypothetical protein
MAVILMDEGKILAKPGEYADLDEAFADLAGLPADFVSKGGPERGPDQITQVIGAFDQMIQNGED